MPNVSSSAVRRVDYDEAVRELIVTFHHGDRYAYLDVAPEVYEELLEVASIGAYLNGRIKPFHEARAVLRPRRVRR